MSSLSVYSEVIVPCLSVLLFLCMQQYRCLSVFYVCKSFRTLVPGCPINMVNVATSVYSYVSASSSRYMYNDRCAYIIMSVCNTVPYIVLYLCVISRMYKILYCIRYYICAYTIMSVYNAVSYTLVHLCVVSRLYILMFLYITLCRIQHKI